jgi:predicted dehydrogenase
VTQRQGDDIRVGLLGYGLAGEFFHAPLIHATPGMRLTAIVTSDAERSSRASARYPDARIVPDGDALWASAADLDLVVVATPNRTHAPLASRAIETGLAVVVDKPLAPTAAEARRLIDQAAAADVMLTVFQNRRWDGDFLTVRRLVGEGRLGNVSRFESRFERWRPVLKPGWRQQPDPAAAGGLLYDLGSHLIDQALLLFGPAREVYAELDRRTPGSEVDDDAFVALTHRSGVRSHLWMSSLAAQFGPRFRVLGDRAGFTKFGLDVQEAALRSLQVPNGADWGVDLRESWGSLGAGGDEAPVETERGAYPEFYRQTAAAVRASGPVPVDPADAVAVLGIIDAARRSAGERQVVHLAASA